MIYILFGDFFFLFFFRIFNISTDFQYTSIFFFFLSRISVKIYLVFVKCNRQIYVSGQKISVDFFFFFENIYCFLERLYSSKS